MLPKTPQHMYTEHITNVEVRNRIERAIGQYEDLKWTSCLKVFWSLKNDHAGYSQTEGEGVARESDGKIISRIGLVYVLLNP